MESGPAPIVARVPEHHSARSYTEGGRNDPQVRATEAGSSNVGKRDANPTWQTVRAREKIPRHVRDAISKRRVEGNVARSVEGQHSKPRAEANVKTKRSEEVKVKARDPSKVNTSGTREEQPRDETPPSDTKLSREERRSEPDVLNAEARQEPGSDMERRGPVRALAMFKRTLESLD